jgi:hypothetical protein
VSDLLQINTRTKNNEMDEMDTYKRKRNKLLKVNDWNTPDIDWTIDIDWNVPDIVWNTPDIDW